MSAKDELFAEVLSAAMPFLKNGAFDSFKMRLVLCMSGYDVEKAETSLTVYEGDANDIIVKRFLMAKIAKGLSKRTIRQYSEVLRVVFSKISKPYDKITADDIRLYLAVRVQKDGVSKTTANNERRYLSTFYTWLQKEEILLRNPMGKVEAVKQSKKKRKAFTQMELEQMRNTCLTTLESALIETLISTWARVSEVAQIRLDEIDGDRILVHGKGDKDRIVYLTPKAQLAIKSFLDDRTDTNPYLFPKGTDLRSMPKDITRKELAEWFKNPQLINDGHMEGGSIEKTVRKVAKRAGVSGAHPHRFRRTGATMALNVGMPLVTVSKLLGHESIATTQLYLDISENDLAQAHKKYV